LPGGKGGKKGRVLLEIINRHRESQKGGIKNVNQRLGHARRRREERGRRKTANCLREEEKEDTIQNNLKDKRGKKGPVSVSSPEKEGDAISYQERRKNSNSSRVRKENTSPAREKKGRGFQAGPTGKEGEKRAPAQIRSAKKRDQRGSAPRKKAVETHIRRGEKTSRNHA